MILHLQVYFSNRVEELYKNLKSNLFPPSAKPFTRRLIIVPSPAMKSWLMMHMAEDPELHIAAGLEIGYLDQTAMKLYNVLSGETLCLIPTTLELALTIESEIKHVLQEWPQELIWEPLIKYLAVKAGGYWSQKSQRRLIALSRKLSSLFQSYGIYGTKMIAEWNPAAPQNWQECLWHRLFNRHSHRKTPQELFSSFQMIHSPDLQVHVFSISFLSALHHEFLEKIGTQFSVSYYVLSPSLAFWSDMRSDWEQARIQAYWQKREVSSAQQQALEEYLRDNNSLLANFGRLGREMAEQIEHSTAQVVEQYIISESVLEHEAYQHLLIDEISVEKAKQPLTLLEAVQTDMVFLRNPEEEEKISFQQYDRSIEVHAAAGKMREVEILYDALMGLIDRHRQTDPILPGDIIVMAPDIGEYIPFIKAVFENTESQLAIQVMDLIIPGQSELVRGVMQLFALPQSRWESSTIFELFENKAFQAKHHFNVEDLQIFKKWIQDSGVLWGTDFCHREELLKKDHCPSSMAEEHAVGTWEDGMKRLIFGLALGSGHESIEMETAQGDLLGYWIHLLRSIRHDLKPLSDGTELTIEQWISYLSCLVESYFSVDKSAEEDEYALQQQWNLFRQASKNMPEISFGFDSILKHLEANLMQERVCYRESDLHAVRFCSLLPMRALPAKVVALMGMQEGAYPRVDQDISLNLLRGNPHADYHPSQIDFDRFLFLEALLSARQYLLISYQSVQEEDFKEQSPSLVVAELIHYLDRSYTIQDQCISSFCIRRHPNFSYHHHYFDSHTSFPSYSKQRFRMAQSFYGLDKLSKHQFIPAFTLSSEVALSGSLLLKQLTAAVRDPLKLYLNKGLNIYLNKLDERVLKDEETFELSPLDLSIIKKTSLKKPLDEILKYQSNLPLGVFKQISYDRIYEGVQALSHNLKQIGTAPEELFSIEFSSRYQKPFQTKHGDWKTPAIVAKDKQGREVAVEGMLKHVSPKGLVEIIDHKSVDAYKAMPGYLALNCLIQEHHLPISGQLLCIKGEKGVANDPLPGAPACLLTEYINYHHLCLTSASPLLPEFLKAFMQMRASKDFVDKVSEEMNNPFKESYRDYLKWLMRGGQIPNPEAYFTQWKEVANSLVLPMLTKWFPDEVHAEEPGE